MGAYEKRGVVRLSSHDAGMEALGSTLDRVQQVEVLHRECAVGVCVEHGPRTSGVITVSVVLPTEYNELKTDLSDFLRDFAQQGKVRINTCTLLFDSHILFKSTVQNLASFPGRVVYKLTRLYNCAPTCVHFS